MAKPPNKPVQKNKPVSSSDDHFLTEISKRVTAVLGASQANQVIAQIVALRMEETFSGPIAHPSHLREYENILPGCADRIVTMAESALVHSQKIRSEALAAEIEDTKTGRKYGFWALLALVIAAVICGLMGHDVLGGAFLGTGILGTVGLLIKAWRDGE